MTPSTHTHSHPEPRVDGVTILEFFEGDVELMREIIEMFIADYPVRIAHLREALDRRDRETLALIAHSLRGSLGNFVAVVEAAAAGRLEAIARDGDWDEVEAAFHDLEPHLTRLIPALMRLAAEESRSDHAQSER